MVLWYSVYRRSSVSQRLTFRYRCHTITIVFLTQSCLDMMTMTTLQHCLEFMVNDYLPRFSPHLGFRRWLLIWAVSRDPTLILLWGCRPQMGLPTSQCPLPMWPISWEITSPKSRDFRQKPHFGKVLLDERKTLSSSIFYWVEASMGSILSKNFRSLSLSSHEI